MNPRLILILSAAAGLAYWVSALGQPFAGSIVLKGASVAALAFLAWPESKLLAVALGFSSLGDVLLELPGFFVWGLASFLMTHLLYIVLFWRFRESARPSGSRIVAMVLVILFSIQFLRVMQPLGNMAAPVYGYISAITIMVLSALRARWPTPWVICGALLFFISDSILGFDRFVWHLPFRDWFVWPTYYGGQLLIAVGVMAQLTRSDRLVGKHR